MVGYPTAAAVTVRTRPCWGSSAPLSCLGVLVLRRDTLEMPSGAALSPRPSTNAGQPGGNGGLLLCRVGPRQAPQCLEQHVVSCSYCGRSLVCTTPRAWALQFPTKYTFRPLSPQQWHPARRSAFAEIECLHTRISISLSLVMLVAYTNLLNRLPPPSE